MGRTGRYGGSASTLYTGWCNACQLNSCNWPSAHVDCESWGVVCFELCFHREGLRVSLHMQSRICHCKNRSHFQVECPSGALWEDISTSIAAAAAAIYQG